MPTTYFFFREKEKVSKKKATGPIEKWGRAERLDRPLVLGVIPTKAFTKRIAP